MKEKPFDILKTGAFSSNDLCQITMYGSRGCLYFNDPQYIENSLVKSGLPEVLFEFLSLDFCANHPVRKHFEEKLGDFPFDLPHLKTIMRDYETIPGIQVTDFKKDHKRTNVNFELKTWATIGQLKFMSEKHINKMHIIVKSSIGEFEI